MGRPKTPRTNGRRGRPAKEPVGFPLDRELTLEKVVILRLETFPKKGDDLPKVGLFLEGILTAEAGKILGFRALLFIENGLAKEGYKRMRLDISQLRNIRMKTDRHFKGDLPLDVRADTIGSFDARPELGKVKVRFRAHFRGFSKQLGDFTDQVGDQAFDLVFQPLQGEMFQPDGQAQPAAVPIRHLQ